MKNYLKNPGILTILLLTMILPVAAESHISYLEGIVTVVREGEEFPGDFGTILRENDLIITGPDSLAILEMEGRGTLKLKDNTKLQLEKVNQSIAVDLRSGGLFSRITKLLGTGYEVRTGDTVAGVRGTEFFVAYGELIEDTPDVWLCVNEGSVEVSLVTSGESLIVNEGEGITIPAGSRLTKPKYYKWTENLNWNSDPAAGELRDETDLSGAYTDLRDFDYD